MNLDRRSFIGIGTILACGVAGLVSDAEAAAPRVLAGGLPSLAGDEEVFKFVRSYSADFRVIGASVLGRIRTSGLRSLHILAKIEDASVLANVLTKAPFSGLYVEGNALTFTLPDVDVTIEHLLPDVFAARLAAMKKRAGNAFAHDALVYDPASGELSDPFTAKTGAVKIVNKTFGSVAALGVILRGMGEGSRLAMPASGEFADWKGRVLRSAARDIDAAKLSSVFLQNLASLAGKVPSTKIVAVLRTRLISSALKKALGIDTGEAIATFEASRKSATADTTDAALWLAALISPEIESNEADGAALTWLRGGTRFQVIRSRTALAEATTFLRQ